MAGLGLDVSPKKKRYVYTDKEDWPVWGNFGKEGEIQGPYTKTSKQSYLIDGGTTPTRTLEKLRKKTEMTIESKP